MIRKAELTDDLGSIASLIYATDSVMPFLFGPKDQALLKIYRLIERDHNPFSWRNLWLYMDEYGKVRGILLTYLPHQRNKEGENSDYGAVFSLNEQFILWVKSWMLSSLEDKMEVSGFYIQNVSVHPDNRGEGIGTQLINHFEKWAYNQGVTSLWLDVALDNSGAKKLYERLGFQLMTQRRLPLLKSGYVRMCKQLLG